MLVRTAMTFHTVFKIPDALVQMLASDLRRRMLMASITGVLSEIALWMASDACRIVIPIQHKVFVMLKGGRLPFFFAVALCTARRQLFVERIAWLGVT